MLTMMPVIFEKCVSIYFLTSWGSGNFFPTPVFFIRGSAEPWGSANLFQGFRHLPEKK